MEPGAGVAEGWGLRPFVVAWRGQGMGSVDYPLFAQRLVRAQEAQLKAAKARNDYLLLLGAANARLRVHFLHDLDHLLDVCETQVTWGAPQPPLPVPENQERDPGV